MINILITGLYDDSIKKTEELAKERTDALHVAGTCRVGDDLYEAISESKPDAVVFALSDAASGIPDEAERVSLSRPTVCMIAYSEQPDKVMYDRAISCGFRYAGTYPKNGTEMLDTITAGMKYIAARLDSIRSTQTAVVTQSNVIGVYSPKAGAGCTFLAINLATSLVQKQKKVLVIDMDLMFGDIASYLGITPKRTISDLCQDFDEYPINTLETYLETSAVGFSFLAAPKAPEYADTVKAEKVAKIVATAKKYYDYIIIDMPSGMTEIHTKLLPLTNRILFVVTDQIPVLINARRAMDVIDIIQQGQKISVVINRYDKRSAVQARDVKKVLQKPVLARIPNDYLMVSNSINLGTPYITGRQDRKGIADAISIVTERILKKQYDTDLSTMSEGEIAKSEAALLPAASKSAVAKNSDGKEKRKTKGGKKTLFLVAAIAVVAAIGLVYYMNPSVFDSLLNIF